mmetsp:Transcript_7115/g.20101  ORF Transcript_7115/g.20101 Transcript_7115/m.20101 type:complete len:230 (-) Transcript_7115:263-952(-)|eukprot:scaffold258113_cov37-Tisochrysis_lutea.AAC.1
MLLLKGLLLLSHHRSTWPLGALVPGPPSSSRCSLPRLLNGGENTLVQLFDESSKKSLSCFVAGTVDVEGTLYGALFPVNAPATVGTMKNGSLSPLEPEVEAAAMSAAQAACLEMGAELLDTPVVLTLAGEAIQEDMELDVRRVVSGADHDSEDDDMVVVADFSFEGQQMFVLRMLDPVYVVGRQGLHPQHFVVPTDEEMDVVGGAIEQLVEEIEEALDLGLDSETEMSP